MRVKTAATIILAGMLLLCLFPIPLVRADDTEAVGTDTEITLEVGGRYADTDGNRTFIYPYSPMDSNGLFLFDLFNIKPGGRSLELDASFSDDQDWSAGFEYDHGASFKVGVRAQQFYHALEHREFAPDFETPAPGFDSVHVGYEDRNPGAEYFREVQEHTAHFKVRAPSYPAHIRGDARVYRKEGPSQLAYFFRTCSTHICHTNSRTRDVDTETQEYNIGFDSHLGPVDVIYNRNFLSFEDKADDPVDFFGDFTIGRPRPGDYPHHVNPETRSFSDEIKVNTNLTNRAALALHYIGGESENRDSDITEEDRRFAATATYLMSRGHFFSAKYVYDRGDVADISDEAVEAREAIGDDVAPETTENVGELTWRWTPRRGAQLHSHVRYTDIGRDGTEESGLPGSTTAWTVDVDGRFKASPGLDLEAELARDWIEDPAFATDFTDRWRYTLGALWTPAGSFSLLARYTGFLGENDDEQALSRGYDEPSEAAVQGLKRDSDGHNLLAAATWTPAETVTFLLSYNYSLNDIRQDQLLGTAAYPDRVFLSEESPFESTYQIGRVQAVWSPADVLQLTLGGMIIDGEESWEPEVAGRPEITEGLAESARHDFTKYMLDAEVRYDFSRGLGLTVAGYYADYDDKVSDSGDGSGGGVLATVSKRW